MPDHSLDDNEPEAEYEYGDIEAAAEDEDVRRHRLHIAEQLRPVMPH